MRRTRVLSIALAAIILFSEITSFQGGRWKVLAKETETVTSLSENTTDDEEIQEEISGEAEENKTTEEVATEEMEAIHIWQETEENKVSYVTEEMYDKPVYLTETSTVRLRLDTDTADKVKNDEKYHVTWSILQGRTGSIPGSVNLTGQEDDWSGFEEQEQCPCFVIETETDITSELYGTALVSGNVLSADVTESYYIRASLWEEEKKTALAVTTLPVVMERKQTEDSGEELQKETDILEEEMAEQEEQQERQTISENNVEEEAEQETEKEEDIREAESTGQSFTSVAETEKEEDEAFQNTEGESLKDKIAVSKLSLNKTSVTLNPGESIRLRVTVTPAGIQPELVWSSEKEQVASVDEEGKVTALGEGTTKITVESEGKQATASVTVELSDAEKNQDQPKDEEGNLLAITDEVWLAGFERESEALVYSGSPVRQDIRVYHKGRLLEEKKDYVLTYRNNVNAAAYNANNAPSVTITMRGQYAGSRTFYYTIAPREIDEEHSLGYEQIVTYAKKLKIPTPTLYYGKKRLVLNKDFVCDYSSLPENYTMGDSYEDGVTYEYTVYGKGNFTGSFVMQLSVIREKRFDLGSAAVTLDKKQYNYCGQPLKKEEVKVLAVKAGKITLEEDLYDYTVQAETAGNGYVEIIPSEKGYQEGYRGKKRITIKVVGDRLLKNTELGENWKTSIVYSGALKEQQGGMCQEKTGILVFYNGEEAEVLTEGIDYTVKYSNHQKVGTAAITFTGIGRYSGSIRKTYKIVPNTELQLVWLETDEKGQPTARYRKNGATVQFRLLEGTEEASTYILNSKTDYSVRYINNRKIGTMQCEITGKGNYKGYKQVAEVEVLTADISQGTMSVADRKYSSRANAWKAPVTITDADGQKLKAGVDYDKDLLYQYEGMETETIPSADTTVYVTAQGINGYAGTSITGSYRIFDASIGSLVIVIDSQEYTGEEIELTASDIHVYANAKDRKQGLEMTEACYEIVGYRNHVKVGTASVTLRGTGGYGGVRNCSFKIVKKQYQTIRVTGVVIEESEILLGVGNSRQLTATVLPENAMNKTLLWSSSNTKVATVNEEGVVTAHKAGKVTIQAKSQDTGKKATCKVSVSVIPIVTFTLNTDKIQQKEGTKYQLQVMDIQPEDATYGTVIWESTNEQIASVDQNGEVSLKKAGMAVIKVSTQDRSYVQKCLVIVEGEETEIEGDYLTPQMFRGLEEDDTKAFNEAINHLTGDCNTVYVPAGTYQINAETGIRLKSNMNLILADGAVLKAIGNSSRNYNMVLVSGVSHVKISGGQIQGERYEHNASSGGEWGMGVGIYDSSDIQISGTAISECWGDGIYLGSTHEADGSGGCKQITVTNCTLSGNRRNNFSIVCADYVTVEGCTIRNANGTAPEYGIDIETNFSSNPCEHITIQNTVFEGNGQASIGIVTNANDIRIEGCTLKGAFINYAGTNVVVSDSVIYGEVDARIGISMINGASVNDGSTAEDVLIATFQGENWSGEICPYGVDDSNPITSQIVTSTLDSSEMVLRIERKERGNKEAGCYLKLGDMTDGKTVALKKGTTYRFEYVVRGTGQWGIKTNQTGWYPIAPSKDEFATGMVTYRANSAKSCNLMLYAVDKINGMWLEVESVKIYEVR